MTSQPFPIFDINNEYESDRRSYLLMVNLITLIISIPLVAGTTLTTDVDLMPWGLLGGAVALSLSLLSRGHTNAAIIAYVGGVIGWLFMSIWGSGLTPGLYVMMFLPLVVWMLLNGGKSIIEIALATAVAIFSAVWLYSDFPNAIVAVSLPFFGLLVMAFMVGLREGTYLGLVSWAMDIQSKDNRRAEMYYDRQRELEEALRQLQRAKAETESLNHKLGIAQKAAEQASNAKSVFLSNMSHELRTPINVVIGYADSMLHRPQMFENTPLPTAHQPYVKLIGESGQYLLGLVNDILDLSKIEAGKLDIHFVNTDLGEICRGVVATSIGLLKEKPIQIRPDFPNDLPTVWADPMRVRQILLNLLSNAIKFTHTGSVTLRAWHEGDCIRIAVTDTGIGISPEALDIIFDRFQQAEHDTDKHYGGTGLGLDISKRLAVMLGSDLQVESQVNQGSTFSFTLKIATAEQSRQTPVSSISDTVTIFEPNNSSDMSNVSTILLIVDDARARKRLRTALESEGALVIEATTSQAVEMASGVMPDIIVIDTKSGNDLLRDLRLSEDTKTTPIVMATSEQDTEEAYPHLRVPKPLKAEAIYAALAEISTIERVP